MKRVTGWLAGVVVALGVTAAYAQTRVTLKSASAGSSYYMMTVQLGEVLRTATEGRITATVEESQGSVQNVREAPRRTGNFVFTSPPGLIRDAQAGRAPFGEGSGYDTIRTLFLMPPVTMHLVFRADAGVNSLADLAGKSFVAGGRGTFTERQVTALLRLFELDGRVRIEDVELNAAVAALRNRRIDGFATGSSHPTSHVQELAATTSIRILSFSPQELERITRADPGVSPVTIAAGTYANQNQPVATFGVPVGAYTTMQMDEQTAYEVTRVFWSRAPEMARQNPWWNAVAANQIAGLGVRLHPGAVRYYTESGVTVPQELR